MLTVGISPFGKSCPLSMGPVMKEAEPVVGGWPLPPQNMVSFFKAF